MRKALLGVLMFLLLAGPVSAAVEVAANGTVIKKVETLNFVGPTISISDNNKTATVTSSGGGGLSGLGSTDNAVLRTDGTGGETAQGSGCTIDDSAVMTCASYATGASTDPYALYDVSTAGDQDFWTGVVSDNLGTTSADDFEVGLGTVAGTTPVFKVSTTGGLTIGDGTSTTLSAIKIDGQAATDYLQTITSLTGPYVTSAITNLATTGGSYSPTLYSLSGTMAGTSGTFTGLSFSLTHSGTLTGTGRTVYANTTMSSTSGTQDLIIGFDSQANRSGAGTTTTYYGARLSKSAIAAGAITNNYALNVDGKMLVTADARTIADSGGAGTATLTLAPTSSNVQLTCSDADGCDITMSETGVLDGTIIRIVNVSANVCNFADTAGVTEIAGAFAMGQYDTLVLEYVVNTWVQIDRSDN